MFLIMLGAPGAGKGTIGKKLAEETGAKYITSGDTFRKILNEDSEIGRKVKKCIEEGKLVPDNLAIKVFEEEIIPDNLNQDIILDGYPRTKIQAEHLDTFLSEKGRKITLTVNIDVSRELIIDRIVNRRICKECNAIYNLKYGEKPKKENVCDKCGGELIQRVDDNETTIRDRLDTYEINTKPLIKYYEKQEKLKNVTANADTSIDELVKIVRTYVGK